MDEGFYWLVIAVLAGLVTIGVAIDAVRKWTGVQGRDEDEASKARLLRELRRHEQ